MILSIAEDETDRKRFGQALDVIVQTDPKELQTTGHGLTPVPRDCVPVVERLVSLFRRIRDSDLEAIPDDLLPTLAREIRRTEYELRQARKPLAPNQPPDQMASSLKRAYQEAYANLAPILAHIGTSPAVFEKLLRQAKTAHDQIKDIAADAGVSQHAAIFGDAARQHRRRSFAWLAVSALLALATLLLAWQMAGQIEDRGLSDTIQFVAARIMLFGVLSYALVSAVRTYRAEAHNRVVNAHRHHALSTFETFTAASSDYATRNAVLMQATQCIFAHRPSGFGQREDDSVPQSQVLELTRSVLPKAPE